MRKMSIEELITQEKKKYFREWRAKNKDKVKAANERYLRKKALEFLENEKNSK